MSAKLSLQDLLEVQSYFNLPSPALVEKDWYVVKALAALQRADTGRFRLVFGGGTSLSRAHRLTHRMSEDIDLKIVSTAPPTRAQLRTLRDNITHALVGTGFPFDPGNTDHRQSGNESRYTIYRLPYHSLITGESVLRPEIKIETAVWPLRRAAVNLDVVSFWAEAFQRPAEAPSMLCADLLEIVAEKFVALTRRSGAELAHPDGPRDKTLVRHVYDLHVVRDHYDPVTVTTLIREIMRADAEDYGHQFPAYREDPIAATRRSVEGLASEQRFATAYVEFVRDMVYGEAPTFESALETVANLAKKLSG